MYDPQFYLIKSPVILAPGMALVSGQLVRKLAGRAADHYIGLIDGELVVFDLHPYEALLEPVQAPNIKNRFPGLKGSISVEEQDDAWIGSSDAYIRPPSIYGEIRCRSYKVDVFRVVGSIRSRGIDVVVTGSIAAIRAIRKELIASMADSGLADHWPGETLIEAYVEWLAAEPELWDFEVFIRALLPVYQEQFGVMA